jgi:hypothetical protein
METTILFAGAGILLVSVVLSMTINRIIQRANATPADPGERSHGIFDVFTQIGKWQDRRQREQSRRSRQHDE